MQQLSSAVQGGRVWIGKYRCALTSILWEGVAAGLNCSVHLRKARTRAMSEQV